MPPSIEETRAKIDALLDSYCNERQAAAAKLTPTYGRLWQTMHTAVGAGGKRLRPYEILLAYAAYGGKDDILPVAAAWEMLHCCLLIHDDIIDRDYVRHGKPNIAGAYIDIYKKSTADNEHYANSAALLAGDLALTSAYVAVLQSNISADEKLIAIKALNDTMFTVAGGELVDTESVMLPIAKVDTEAIMYLKSARYSLIDPLMLGATLAGASQTELKKIERFGKAAGIGFQLADDLLGLFGNQQQTGKSTIGDLREGKRTQLLQETIKRASSVDRKKVTSIVGRGDITEADAQFVRDLATTNGAKQAIEDRIDSLVQEAVDVAQTLQIPAAYQRAFEQLVAAVTKRNH